MNLYPARGDAAERQTRTEAALVTVASVRPVNLQFTDRGDLFEDDGFDTLAVLETDARTIAQRAGPRKPVVSELFTRLAEAAVGRGARYFGFANSDIVVTPAAVERVARGDHRAYVFSRSDFDPGTDWDRGPMVHGTDVFVVEADWWLANCRYFRPYVLGEMCWDNVYTAQLLCWAGGVLLNRDPLVRHELHAIVWRDSPFAAHNGYLGALDRLYFTRWAGYVARLEALRAAAGGLADEMAEDRLQREAFGGWRPGVVGRLIQGLRVARLVARRTTGTKGAT